MLSNQNVSKLYMGPIDTTQTISFDIPYISSANLQVTVVEEDGSQSEPLREVTDYTVTPVYNEGIVVGATIQLTGTVTVSATQRLGVERVTPLTQETDFPENGDFESNSIETSLDKLTMITQELKAKDDRNITANILESSDFNVEIPLSTEDTRVLTIDSSGIGVSDISVDDITTSMEVAEDAADASANSAQQAANSAQQAANSAQQAQDTVTSGIEELEEVTQENVDEINAAAQAASGYVNNAKIWAEGTDSQVEDLGGEKSAKGWAQLAEQSVQVVTMALLDIGIAPCGIDETENKRRYLNGQLIIQDQFSAAVTKLKTLVGWNSETKTATLRPNLVKSETEWQAIKTASAYGQVGAFVIDDEAGTVRLPAVVNIQGLFDLQNAGLTVDAGLPNIEGGPEYTGNAKYSIFTHGLTGENGCIKYNDIGTMGADGGVYGVGNFSIDASLSNPIYGNSDTVQPESIQYPYFIQLNTGATDNEPTINDYTVTTAYSYGMSQYYKGVMNNGAWLRSNGQWNSGVVYVGLYNWILANYNSSMDGFKASTDEYTDYDFVINTTNTTFRLPLKNGTEGMFASTAPVIGNGISLGLTNGTSYGGLYASNSAGYTSVNSSTAGYGNSSLGSSVSTTTSFSDLQLLGVTTNPDNSGLIADLSNITIPTGWNLYYYCGNVEENPQLVNVARIEEILVDLKVSSTIGLPIFTLSNELEVGEIWLEGATVSRTTYSQLFAIYGTTYGEGDGSTTFQLPDFRNRAVWGADNFGYLSAGLPNITGSITRSVIGSNYVASGALSAQVNRYSWSINSGSTQDTTATLQLSASKSSSIYGGSSTVQPPSIKVRVKTRYV